VKRCRICDRRYLFDPNDRFDGCCSCYYGKRGVSNFWWNIMRISLGLFLLWRIYGEITAHYR